METQWKRQKSESVPVKKLIGLNVWVPICEWQKVNYARRRRALEVCGDNWKTAELTTLGPGLQPLNSFSHPQPQICLTWPDLKQTRIIIIVCLCAYTHYILRFYKLLYRHFSFIAHKGVKIVIHRGSGRRSSVFLSPLGNRVNAQLWESRLTS